VNSSTRSVWSEIDLDALRANVRALCAHAAPAELLAVVKANGYGHGAVPVARAALQAGASWLGIARVEEGVQLREAGIDAPVMILSEPSPAAVADIVAHDITPVVYTAAGIDALAKGVAEAGRRRPFPVHLKVDTGMHRVGCTPADAVALARQVATRDELTLTGVCTHLAVADEPEDSYTPAQLDRFDAVLAALDDAGLRPPMVHAANSAGLLAHPRAHHSLVRVGIAMYGLPPAPGLPDEAGVAPAPGVSLRAPGSKV
jgi:alanine racemase